MTYAILNRDGSFREWAEDIDVTKVRPGCWAEASVDPLPTPGPAQVVEDDTPVKQPDGTYRRTWKLVTPGFARASMVPTLAFVDRLTPTEWDAFETLASQSPELRVALRRLNHAHEVDLADPNVIAAVDAATQYGVLAPGRAAEILRY